MANDFPERPSIETEVVKKLHPSFLYIFFLFGVILPAIALIIELKAHWCAERFFDPIPTWWNVLLVAFVPATNFQVWNSLRRGEIKRPLWLSFAIGIAIFVSFYYSVIFAPLTPIAVIAVLYAFLGFLALAPLLSLIMTLWMCRKLKLVLPKTPAGWFSWKAFAGGFVLVFALLGLSELKLYKTRAGIENANSKDAAVQRDGLASLRRYGDENYLLKLCFDGVGFATPLDFLLNFPGFTSPREPEKTASAQARKAFYRLTGKTYREVPAPSGVREWDRLDRGRDTRSGDFARVELGLSLASSQIDGTVDSDAAIGYLEWTMVFENKESWTQESASQIQLPPDSVVSRLTLWIDGEEREAAFAGTAKVANAYNTVTAKKRDPALVTLIGKDRIQLKCSPVPANGQMKVRIGITAPVSLSNRSVGFLAMPYFHNKNFTVATEHSVWIESRGDLQITNRNFTRDTRDGVYGVRGKVNDDTLSTIGSPIKVIRNAEVLKSWARDKNIEGSIVRQEFKETAKRPVKSLLLIIDTSAGMAESQNEIAESIRKLSPDTRLSLVLAGGNGLNAERSDQIRPFDTPSKIAGLINEAEFGGGSDAVPALETTWESDLPTDCAVIWLHGPQPQELSPNEELAHLFARKPLAVPVFSIQNGTGKNTAESALDKINVISTVPRFGTLGEDLTRTFANISDEKTALTAVRASDRSVASNSANTKETSQHLVRLWAKDEVLRLMRKGNEQAAIDLAVKNQLVTPVTGAVVLETKAQYDQFGLDPVDPNSVPTIPEPEEYLLFAIVGAVFLLFLIRIRKVRMRAV